MRASPTSSGTPTPGSCRVALAPTSVEVTDDGRGAGATATGSGLRGLRERATAAGATVVTRSLSPGFSLSVVRAG